MECCCLWDFLGDFVNIEGDFLNILGDFGNLGDFLFFELRKYLLFCMMIFWFFRVLCMDKGIILGFRNLLCGF